MSFSLEKSIEILERTPKVLKAMLLDISADWITNNEGGETWNVVEVVKHLIDGENTNWIPRVEVILSAESDKNFPPFDRFAHLKDSSKSSLSELLNKFAEVRKNSLGIVRAKNITAQELEAKGLHPAFGEVTLSQLLATWVVHDLDHISQISRIIAKQYQVEVGPWVEYLKILKQ